MGRRHSHLNPIISTEIDTAAEPPHQSKKGPRKRANIKIATLNMNGAHIGRESQMSFEKWSEINATMKKERIAILALQETHLDEQSLSDVNCLFGKRLVIHNSQDENNPRSTAGVAFTINKDLLVSQTLEIYELAKGRALALKTNWNNQEETLLLNVYAPNRRMDHRPFWDALESERQRLHLRKPDFILGDFNVTEDAMDRSPPKSDSERATDALRDLRLALDIQDQWRHLHPKTREFTYRATHNVKQIKSRLDRIYVATNKAHHTYEWTIGPTSVLTDHWLVAVKYAPKGAPHIGNGRWTWPLKSLNNMKLVEKIERLGISFQQEVRALPRSPNDRDRNHNIQTLWKSFKQEISTLTKEEMKKSHYKRLTMIRNLQNDQKSLLENPEFESNEQLSWQEALIADKIAYLERVNSHNSRTKLRAKIAHYGERLGGIWSDLNKIKKPRDVILRLAKPDLHPPQYETISRKMANLARQYHNNLQDNGLSPRDAPDQNANKREAPHQTSEEELREVLNAIPDSQKFNRERFPDLSIGITSDYVRRALKLAKNNSATGLNGCSYELWKRLDALHQEAEKVNHQGFDIIGILTKVFQDIQRYGIEQGTNFTEGWMCPIFKKKDRTKIENYRPITLLNSDYKTFTKALSLQLLEPIDELIHRDQAGFIPGRSIFDHIRLTRVMITTPKPWEPTVH